MDLVVEFLEKLFGILLAAHLAGGAEEFGGLVATSLVFNVQVGGGHVRRVTATHLQFKTIIFLSLFSFCLHFKRAICGEVQVNLCSL